MSRIPDAALRLQWQRRLLKFQAFYGSVRQFCHDEGVSVSSFYQWRAKLNVVRRSAKNKSHTAALRSNAAGGNGKSTHFIPLQLVPEMTCHPPGMTALPKNENPFFNHPRPTQLTKQPAVSPIDVFAPPTNSANAEMHPSCGDLGPQG